MSTKKVSISLAVIGLMLIFATFVLGQPTGAGLTNVSTSQKNSTSPDWGNHSKGAIHTIMLSAEQQDTKWKAYVGNVSSTLVLDDEQDYSIYRWSVDSFSGQVYITRSNSITWNTVQCASAANKATEDTQLTHDSTKSDSVNRTFTLQAHKSFTIGSSPIGNNTCYSVATWQNDTSQTPSNTTPFTEVLLWDTTGSSMIYTTFVENDKPGYRNIPSLQNVTYDFQAIIPDNATATSPAIRYYFYLELTS